MNANAKKNKEEKVDEKQYRRGKKKKEKQKIHDLKAHAKTNTQPFTKIPLLASFFSLNRLNLAYLLLLLLCLFILLLLLVCSCYSSCCFLLDLYLLKVGWHLKPP